MILFDCNIVRFLKYDYFSRDYGLYENIVVFHMAFKRICLKKSEIIEIN